MPYTGAAQLNTPYAVWIDDGDIAGDQLTHYLALVLLYTEGARKGYAEFRIIRKGCGINAKYDYTAKYSNKDIASYGEFVDYISRILRTLAYPMLVSKV